MILLKKLQKKNNLERLGGFTYKGSKDNINKARDMFNRYKNSKAGQNLKRLGKVSKVGLGVAGLGAAGLVANHFMNKNK